MVIFKTQSDKQTKTEISSSPGKIHFSIYVYRVVLILIFLYVADDQLVHYQVKLVWRDVSLDTWSLGNEVQCLSSHSQQEMAAWCPRVHRRLPESLGEYEINSVTEMPESVLSDSLYPVWIVVQWGTRMTGPLVRCSTIFIFYLHYWHIVIGIIYNKMLRGVRD